MLAVIDQIIVVVENEIAAGTAHPISDDIPTLIRTLGATTVMAFSGDPSFLRPGDDMERTVGVLEKLWLHALWGGKAI
jgi:hypothetical protein